MKKIFHALMRTADLLIIELFGICDLQKKCLPLLDLYL